ncbi:hypothetical protein D3C86_486430 [compost metagenome]
MGPLGAGCRPSAGSGSSSGGDRFGLPGDGVGDADSSGGSGPQDPGTRHRDSGQPDGFRRDHPADASHSPGRRGLPPAGAGVPPADLRAGLLHGREGVDRAGAGRRAPGLPCGREPGPQGRHHPRRDGLPRGRAEGPLPGDEGEGHQLPRRPADHQGHRKEIRRPGLCPGAGHRPQHQSRRDPDLAAGRGDDLGHPDRGQRGDAGLRDPARTDPEAGRTLQLEADGRGPASGLQPQLLRGHRHPLRARRDARQGHRGDQRQGEADRQLQPLGGLVQPRRPPGHRGPAQGELPGTRPVGVDGSDDLAAQLGGRDQLLQPLDRLPEDLLRYEPLRPAVLELLRAGHRAERHGAERLPRRA